MVATCTRDGCSCSARSPNRQEILARHCSTAELRNVGILAGQGNAVSFGTMTATLASGTGHFQLVHWLLIHVFRWSDTDIPKLL